MTRKVWPCQQLQQQQSCWRHELELCTQTDRNNKCGAFMGWSFARGNNLRDTRGLSPSSAAIDKTAGPGKPVPDKYAFQATDKRTDRQTHEHRHRIKPTLLWRGLKIWEPWMLPAEHWTWRRCCMSVDAAAAVCWSAVLHHHHDTVTSSLHRSASLPSPHQASLVAPSDQPNGTQLHLHHVLMATSLIRYPTAPCHRLSFCGWRASCVAGPSARNSLPDSLRNLVIGENSFGQSLKTFLFATYWRI